MSLPATSARGRREELEEAKAQLERYEREFAGWPVFVNERVALRYRILRLERDLEQKTQ